MGRISLSTHWFFDFNKELSNLYDFIKWNDLQSESLRLMCVRCFRISAVDFHFHNVVKVEYENAKQYLCYDHFIKSTA